jgi:flagellar basal-body rod modification protein FlgD
METTGIGAGSGATQSGQSSNDALRGLDLDEFLKLMITELQNQDPLNPLENHQILQQISQIREIEATSQLRETLDAVLLGTNLANASSLLDKQVKALDDQGEIITGKVDRVSVADNKVRLHVGNQQVDLKNLSEILPAEA